MSKTCEVWWELQQIQVEQCITWGMINEGYGERCKIHCCMD